MKDKYKYLVSFVCKSGTGAQVITTSKKIRSGKDLDLIGKFIEADRCVDGVVITNYILMDTKWGVWDWFKAIVELVLLVFCILAVIASIFGYR